MQHTYDIDEILNQTIPVHKPITTYIVSLLSVFFNFMVSAYEDIISMMLPYSQSNHHLMVKQREVNFLTIKYPLIVSPPSVTIPLELKKQK